MVINAKTKISAIVRENKDSIDAIASLSKPLRKLKNPLLRRVMASRVTLLEASKMGGCSIEDFVRVLEPLGFTYEKEDGANGEELDPEPEWLKNLDDHQITNFDVRPILEGNGDPLKAIMDHLKGVPAGGALCVIVGFLPVPLVNRLTKKGDVLAYSRQLGPTEFHTFFYKVPKMAQASGETGGANYSADSAGQVFKDTQADFEALCAKWPADKKKEIDVRELEMPLPRMTILEELSNLPDGMALYVNHKRVPIYLLEDLSEMEFVVHLTELGPGNVKMLLYKA